jgi:hypothetical protein
VGPLGGWEIGGKVSKVCFNFQHGGDAKPFGFLYRVGYGSRLPVTRYKPFIIFNRYSMLLGICNITPFIGSSKFPSVSQLTNRKLVFFMNVGDGLWLSVLPESEDRWIVSPALDKWIFNLLMLKRSECHCATRKLLFYL